MVLAALAHGRRRGGADEADADEAAADEAAGIAGGLSDRDRGGTLAFAGFLLSLLSVVTILFVGLPALVLPSC